MATTLHSRLEKRFRGELLTPADPGYEQARTVWNADIDRRPRLIARCADAADVAQAVLLARDEALPFSVRGGGHGVGGHAVVENGLMIDLSPLKSVRVDPARNSVRAQAGVVLGVLDRATQPFGAAVPAGIVTHTGIAGLTLGGGIGWLMRKHGATVDSLISAEVVTADGVVLTANAQEEPDLFWGLRGGGGNFGVVTSFEFRTHPVGPSVLAGTIGYALDDGAEVLRRYREAVADAPDELTTIVNLRQVPALPAFPAEHHGRTAVTVNACYAGDLRHGENVVRPLRSLGRPLYDLIRPRPFVELQRMFDASVPWGWGYYWKSWEVPALGDGVLDRLLDAASHLPTPESYAIVFQLGGAIARVPDDATAYPQRSAGFNVNINGVWRSPEKREGAVRWARELYAALDPETDGRVYVNFLGEEGADRVRAAYGPEKYARLVALKNRFDPDNIFRLNQNVRPSQSPK